MSQKILLVKYELEDEIPLDETSKVLQSAYIPDELINWLSDNNYSFEIQIKEEAGVSPDIPVTFITFENCLRNVLPHIETNLVSLIQQTKEHTSGEVIAKKELDNDFDVLSIWLNMRKVLKEKIEKFAESENIKIIIG
ncbi:hypothetical protein [Xenorhabdus japonica]|uniref:Uncharacterized protein n=1 Tax=Xenorhabdus japonica TaxID=53341 RepID=A0A1I4YPF6_9GAMM|nr:hypothetical protein [Xenorhabdus japonica]SFN39896.1 hypothetical protein SAMN05421579_102182 [Xenorhabdus japonica]